MPDNKPGAQPGAERESLRAKRPRIAGLIFGATALAGLFAFFFHVGDIESFATALFKTDPAWIALALAAQFLAFLAQALLWSLVLRLRKARVARVDLLLLSVGKLFADQAIPSAGVSGAVFFIHALSRRGVAAGDAFTAFVFGGASSILAFLIFSFGAVAVMSMADGAAAGVPIDHSDLHYFALASLLLLFAIAAFWLSAQGKAPLNSSAIARARDDARKAFVLIWRERGLFAACLGLQSLARLLDAVTLWIAFQALGGGVSFPTAVIAVSLASLAATLAPTPMGLGSFEAGLVAALAALGTDLEFAFAGGVIYRGLSLFLPLALGFFIVQRELLKK